MTPTLVALCPVLDRPRNLGPLVQSWTEGIAGESVEASMLFLANPEDHTEIEALEARGLWYEVVPWKNGPRDYVRKMLWGIERTTSDWILLAADDLRFHRGWFRHAVSKHVETGCLVIGTNDMANPLVKAGKHATHPLLHRDYVKQGTIDNPNEVLHSAYMHNSVDVEFCETAIARGEFAFAEKSLVEHLHPTFHREVKRDQTYVKGLRYATIDRQLCQRRRHLWDPRAARVVEQVERRRMVRARPAPVATWPPR